MSDATAGAIRVETTTDSQAEAERLAASLIEARLAACVQVTGPITSYYRWEGQVNHDPEWLLVIKTAADRAEAVAEHLRQHHSYDVPEIIAVPIVGGNPDYLNWVTDETR